MTDPGNAAPNTPAGWYPDTTQPGSLRWWDGTQWTEQRQNQSMPPLAPVIPLGSPRSNGLATWSLILGIAGFIVIPFVASLAAIITGSMALKRAIHSNGTIGGNGTALAGIVLGAVGMLWGFVMISVLAAVAIPVFIGQSSKAHASVAKAHAMAIVQEIESCAAGTTDGSLTGCTADGITGQLSPADRAMVERGCASAAGACLSIDGNSYRVQANVLVYGSIVGFKVSSRDGTLSKTCTGSTDSVRVVCPGNTW